MPLPWAGLLVAAAAKWLTRRAMRYGRHARDSHRGRHERTIGAMTTPETPAQDDTETEPVLVDPAPDQAVVVESSTTDEDTADDDDEQTTDDPTA